MRKVFFIIVIILLTKFSAFSEWAGPPEHKPIYVYPFTIVIKGDGREDQECGNDMSRVCFYILKYPGMGLMLNAGDKISMFRPNAQNDKGIIDAILVEPLDVQK